ncbi:hypothetical protein BD310DRAFT_637356 [Dichomitus squalens]|uniref:Uncharacterized protein n=1 Tax=Dichomitus squalens TaxID=114155 RepID=A0A4Q9PP76_9APHY|nr:hypothetical protein BD310DRAFT_637356 [Dichomitus squalens]
MKEMSSLARSLCSHFDICFSSPPSTIHFPRYCSRTRSPRLPGLQSLHRCYPFHPVHVDHTSDPPRFVYYLSNDRRRWDPALL